MNKTAMDKLEKVQNACLRIALGLRRDTPVEILQIEGGCEPMIDRLQIYSVNHWLEFRRRFPRSVSVNDTTQHHLHHYTTNEHLFGKMPKYKGTDWAHILGFDLMVI